MDFFDSMKKSWHWLALTAILLGVIYALGSGSAAPDAPLSTGAASSYESYQVFTYKVTLTNDSVYNNVTIPLVIGLIRQIWINNTGTNVSSFLIVDKSNAVWYSQTGVTAALVINGTYLNRTSLLPYYYGPLTLAFRNGTMAGNASTLLVEITSSLTV